MVAQQQCWSGCSGGDVIVFSGPPAAGGFYVICPLSCIVLNFCFCLNRWMEPRFCNTARTESGKTGSLNWFIVRLIPLSLCSFNDSFHNGIYMVSSQLIDMKRNLTKSQLSDELTFKVSRSSLDIFYPFCVSTHCCRSSARRGRI